MRCKLCCYDFFSFIHIFLFSIRKVLYCCNRTTKNCNRVKWWLDVLTCISSLTSNIYIFENAYLLSILFCDLAILFCKRVGRTKRCQVDIYKASTKKAQNSERFNLQIKIRNPWTLEWGSWHCTGDRDQDHPHGKEMQKNKMAVCGGLTNSCEKKRSEKQRRKGKI